MTKQIYYKGILKMPLVWANVIEGVLTKHNKHCEDVILGSEEKLNQKTKIDKIK